MGKPEKKQKRGEGKAKKDKNAPKKPVGGAYGVFNNEKREEFTKLAQANGAKGFAASGAAAKMASEAWKKLSDAQKKPYEENFQKASEEYKKALEEYKAK